MRIAEQDDPATDRPYPADHNGAVSFGREWRALEALVRAALRAGRLKLSIWMMKAKISLLRLGIIAAAVVLALFFVIAGGIFLYVGCYHVLTDVFHLKTAYACLIFGGLHLVVVALIGLAASILLHRRRRPA